MTTSTQRVGRYRATQRESDRRLLTTWVSPETLKRLRELAKGGSLGALIDQWALQGTPKDSGRSPQRAGARSGTRDVHH